MRGFGRRGSIVSGVFVERFSGCVFLGIGST